MVKRAYIGTTAKAYNKQRFEGTGGQYVNQREMNVIEEALTDDIKRVLDVPTGTGRSTLSLRKAGHQMVSMDLSMDMLKIVFNQMAEPSPCLAQADATSLPVASSTFDACISLRFLHFFGPEQKASQIALFREFSRVVRPGGTIVFDTNRWSPRHLKVSGRQISTVFFHKDNEMLSMLEEAGLKLVTKYEMFFIAPILYNKLPKICTKQLEKIENILPSRWRVRVFWICQNSID